MKIRLKTYDSYYEDNGIGYVDNFRTFIFGATFKFGYMAVSEKGFTFMFFFMFDLWQQPFDSRGSLGGMGFYVSFMLKLF